MAMERVAGEGLEHGASKAGEGPAVRGVGSRDRLGAVRRINTFLLALLLAGVADPRRAAAQVRPDLEWRTLTSAHFRVHFTAELEELARRTARNAEFAYARLSTELVPPRGTVDLVLADNVDFANGYATPYPSNRIVIYARPPVDATALRNHEDWNLILVTHELTHIFHLDRAAGIWGGAQRVFGRAALFFPNSYAPSWILEGLAVHYESKFGGGGRLAGTEFPMLARAAALSGGLPPLNALSVGAPRFPGGNSVYLYGSFAITRADSARMGSFVEVASRRLLPWRHDANARSAFGISFTERWAAWRDSVSRAATLGDVGAASSGTLATPSTGTVVSTLTRHGFIASFPRFTSDTELVYVAADARSSPGLYRLNLRGDRERTGRRNSVDVNVPLPGGGTLQAEFDYTDPYSIRSELLVDRRGRRRQLTHGERLSSPDVHGPSGRIVAVKTVPGSTHLVMLDSADGWLTHLVARGTIDLNWADPRLSHDGQRIAAVRWQRGGRMSVVVLDTTGAVLQTFAPRGPRLTVVGSPVWVPGDSTLLFVSDHEGRPLIYRGDVRTGAYALIWTSRTGLSTPDVSPDGHRIAAVELRGDGYHVVTREMPGEVPNETPLTLPTADTLTVSLATGALVGAATVAFPAAVMDSAALESRFSPVRQLLPQWWLPVVLTTDPGTLAYGAMTSARDVVGRHAYTLSVAGEFKRQEATANLSYAYGGLGNPVLYGDLVNEWQHGAIRNTGGQFVGYLGERSRRASVGVVAQRPRVRVRSFVALGGEVEQVAYRSYPANLLALLGNAALLERSYTEALQVAAGFSTMQQPALAVSAEDGITGAVSFRERFGAGVGREDISETIVTATVAKSLELPGFARHVIAARAAYGVTGAAATSAFSAGGVNGSSLSLAPGVMVGGSARTFGVRGFDGGTQLGVRAAAGSVEYRAPLSLIGRGVKLLPIFFQKTSVTAFAETGAAWCTQVVAGSFLCGASPLKPRAWLASAGAEFALDASFDYDVIYRFRFGFAHPVKGLQYAPRANTLYFALGGTF